MASGAVTQEISLPAIGTSDWGKQELEVVDEQAILSFCYVDIRSFSSGNLEYALHLLCRGFKDSWKSG